MKIIKSIDTVLLEKKLRGQLKLEIDKSSCHSTGSLERELCERGYTSMQHKLLKQLSTKDSASAGRIELDGKTASKYIKEISEICISRAESEDKPQVNDAIYHLVSNSFIRVDRDTIYFTPWTVPGSAKLSEAIRTVGPAHYGSDKLSPSQERNIRNLLITKSQKTPSQRKELISAAYQLGMDLAQTNEFLTKAAMTYSLDYSCEWERKAAYLITYEPVQADSPPMLFSRRINELSLPDDNYSSPHIPELSQKLDFLQRIKHSFFEQWLQLYRQCRSNEEGLDFLMDWCWRLILHEDANCGHRSYAEKNCEKLQKLLSHMLAELEELILASEHKKPDIADLKPELYSRIADCISDRHFNLLYSIYRLAAPPPNPDRTYLLFYRKNADELVYHPAFKDDGFFTLSRNTRNIGDIIHRSDILSLGIESGMDLRSIDSILQSAGFYRIYVKDIWERALYLVLEKEAAAATGVSSLDTEGIKHRKAAIKAQLERNMAELDPEYLKKLLQHNPKPKWVRRLDDDFQTD